MSDLSPEQLDRIEDRLEGLSAAINAPRLLEDPDPEVSKRLGEYAALSALARENLQADSPRPGVLDAVLAEARGGVVKPTRRWTRFAPLVGLAGGAALVLWIVKPDVDSTSLSPEPEELTALVDTTPTIEPAAEKSLTVEEKPKAPAQAEAAARLAEKESPPSLEEPSQVTPAKQEVVAEDQISSQKKRRAGQASSVGKGAGLNPELANAEAPLEDASDPTSDGSEKDAWWERLSAADSKLGAGSCELAVSGYRQLLEEVEDPSIRSRAYAGLGLCAELDGDEDAARKHWAKARQASPGVSRWIEEQRSRLSDQVPKSEAARKKSEPAPPDAYE